MHPSASTPSLQVHETIVDPIAHIASQMSSTLNRQTSMWAESTYNNMPYNEWHAVASQNIGNGFYVDNGYTADQPHRGFRGFHHTDPCAVMTATGN